MTTHNLRETYTKKFNNFNLTLRGDGSILPELKIQGGRFIESNGTVCGYTGADNLRAMTKQLKKWAKALEEAEASGS